MQQNSNSHINEPGHVMQHSSMSMSHSQHSSSGDGQKLDPQLKAQIDKQHADLLKQAAMPVNIPSPAIENFFKKKSVETKRKIDDHMKRMEREFKKTQKELEKQMAAGFAGIKSSINGVHNLH